MVVHLWFSTIRFLDRHAATPTQVSQSSPGDRHATTDSIYPHPPPPTYQYLSVLHRSGKRETIRGPAVLYENPVLHQKIEGKDTIQLTAPTEALVVYTEVSVGMPVESSATFDATPVEAKVGLGAEEKQEEAEATEGYNPTHEKSVSRRIIRGPAIFVVSALNAITFRRRSPPIALSHHSSTSHPPTHHPTLLQMLAEGRRVDPRVCLVGEPGPVA